MKLVLSTQEERKTELTGIYVVDKRSKILDMETSVLNTQVVLHKEDQRYLGGEFPHCQGNIYLKFLIWSKQRII